MKLVKEVMSRSVRYVEPETNLRDAAKFMREFDLGALPVVKDGEVVGMVTDRDIVVRGMAEDGSRGESPVQSVMSERAVACHSDQTVDEAASLMREKQVRRLLVVDRGGQLAGICSLGDLAIRTESDVAGQVLKDVSKSDPEEQA